MRTKIMSVVAGVLITFPLVVVAQTQADNATLQQLQQQIAALQEQVEQLQARIKVLQQQLDNGIRTKPQPAPISSACPVFSHTLYRGVSDEDSAGEVTKLQKMLAADPTVYPEKLVTGYYGSLTEKAVQRWQAKQGIVSSGSASTTGYGAVGSRTRARIIIACPTPSPVPIGLDCKADSDCPTNYRCEATEVIAGTVCSNSDPDCKPTSDFMITKGVCKLRAGNKCGSDQECQGSLICHAAVCTNPIGRQCNGSSDTSCPSGYQCIQSCGPPVGMEGDPPPPYYCELNEYAAKPRMCPICLAGNTQIDTPLGLVSVKDLQVGMPIWTTDKAGRRISGVVIKTSKVPVPPTHQMVHLVLDDGREVFASPGHPIIDGRTVGDLTTNDLYDGAHIVASDRVGYSDGATYDILPSGETGFYWANGVLLDSTLH